ncbi:hypothetical protein MTR67_015405 [Solanum verrucosum]|uniref:Uncharacterized protein n=1 Tax=Solanum verrucosum TaxID=315347 RepID=A0AAF0QIS3_SOLVR|nr:hypothetical protein MTR67_015405 [Solanum verrucosum]
MLELFINDVERELDKKVKIVRSNRGGEYDGTYDETGQHLCPFGKFFDTGIHPQCIMLDPTTNSGRKA